jgi:hypothetical protein
LTLQCNSYYAHYVLWIYDYTIFCAIFIIHLKPRVESFWGVLSCCLTPSILFNFRYRKIKILCSHIFIIHNDHTYITEDYTKLCLNIICNRSFFILKWCQLCSGPNFTQGWKDIGANCIYNRGFKVGRYPVLLPVWDRV